MSHAADPETTLRARALCGRCKASCYMVWHAPKDSPTRLSADSLPHGAARARDLDCWYLVRCTFFRITVASPEQLASCSSFAARAGGPD